MTNVDLDALADDLDDFKEPTKKGPANPREERNIAGFEEIQKFVEEHGRAPEVGPDKDIFERIYAIRLQQIRRKQECRDAVQNIDHQNLLDVEEDNEVGLEDINLDALSADLADDFEDDVGDITQLKHVRPRAEIQAAEQIGNRKPCIDFDEFKRMFEEVLRELKEGIRETIIFRKNAGFTKTDIKQDQFIILEGQTCYIAEIGEPQTAPNGEYDARLRVVYDNGTEGDILLRTLIRAMYRDETCRLISDPEAGPLFTGKHGEGDIASGTI